MSALLVTNLTLGQILIFGNMLASFRVCLRMFTSKQFILLEEDGEKKLKWLTENSFHSFRKSIFRGLWFLLISDLKISNIDLFGVLKIGPKYKICDKNEFHSKRSTKIGLPKESAVMLSAHKPSNSCRRLGAQLALFFIQNAIFCYTRRSNSKHHR